MPKIERTCRVCGKKYKQCLTPNPEGVFRWFDVACCREHGMQFLMEIQRSRGELPDEPADNAAAENTAEQEDDAVEGDLSDGHSAE